MALIGEERLWRSLLRRAVDSFGGRFEIVAECDEGESGLGACLRQRPDLVLLDLDLRRCDAVEVARNLRRRLPSTRLLAVAGGTDPITLNLLAEIGVLGFIDTGQPVEVLEKALLEVGAGRRYWTAMLTTNQQRLRQDPASFPKILTAREQDVLRHVVRGCTSRAIAHRLRLSPRSIETVRYRLMRKLEVRNVAGLMEFAFRNGLAPAAESRCAPVATGRR